jgi:predicted ABC-type ATPase
MGEEPDRDSRTEANDSRNHLNSPKDLGSMTGSNPQPVVIVIAGPNGAGKSTAAPTLLHGALGVTEFVNADTIAGGLSAFNSEGVALAAGRVMLARLKTLARSRESFAFETTLASRSFAPWLAELKAAGYSVHVFFLWLASADLALKRVAERVAIGGHNVPAATVRRRHRAGIRNFFALYKPLASTWRFYDASGQEPRPIARQVEPGAIQVYDEEAWNLVTQQGHL